MTRCSVWCRWLQPNQVSNRLGFRPLRRAQQKGTVQSHHYGGARGPQIIEEAADLVATSDPAAASFVKGERIFHQKFGYGLIASVSGNKLTVPITEQTKNCCKLAFRIRLEGGDLVLSVER